jgi:uncharacterized damage-inducible protein DinB
MEPEAIRELYEYSYWAFDLIWPSIDGLSDEQFRLDLGYSAGSIRNQIIHLISSHRRWLHRLQGREPARHLAFDDFQTRSSVADEWKVARSEMMEYINSLDRDALAGMISYQIPGRAINASHHRWQILMQLVNHATDHRAQMLTLLNTQFNIETPEQDFIIFLWRKGQEA